VYELVIFHRAEEVKVEVPAAANVLIRQVDLNEPLPKEMGRLWRAQQGAAAPWMVLRYPMVGASAPTAWAGPVSPEAIAGLFDSPTRREIAGRIISGQSAVWVLLESGDVAADEEAAELLKTELARLQVEIALPDPIEGNEYDAADEWPDDLRIEFSMLRLRRDDPAERVLVAMLLRSEPGLAELTEPMALPVFARGRVLYALVGGGIEPRNIAEASEYVTGACSCEAKRDNPGTDLLTAADWDAAVKRQIVAEYELGILADRLGAIAPVGATAPAATAPVEATETAEESWIGWWGLPAALGLLGVVSVVAYVLGRPLTGRKP